MNVWHLGCCVNASDTDLSELEIGDMVVVKSTIIHPPDIVTGIFVGTGEVYGERDRNGLPDVHHVMLIWDNIRSITNIATDYPYSLEILSKFEETLG